MPLHQFVKVPLWCSTAAVLALSFQAGGENGPQSEAEAIARIRATGNEHEKRETLRSWMDRMEVPAETGMAEQARQRAAAQPLSADELLAFCLQDPSPVVVAEAVSGVGRVRAKRFEADLIAIYAASPKQFGGYAERVQFAIIRTLGVIGTKPAARLFTDLLARDNGSVGGSELLAAIRKLGDPSLISHLERYALRLDGYIAKGKELKHDPMIDAIIVRNAALAREIAVELGKGKGE
ncbi:MAG: HEAT repeat domain-containing protein [Chitinispirillaceae bacterium]|nr:HEAT repeat domain-containing protein [Chitinispirillaceae bacterium]